MATITDSNGFVPCRATSGGVVITDAISGSTQMLTVQNTVSGATDVPVKFIGNAVGDHMVGFEISGDTNPRHKVDAAGDVQWGSGSATTDLDMNRTGVGTLTISDGTNANNNVILKIAGTSASNQNAIYIKNGVQPPTPSGGGMLFVVSGALKYIGSSGTVTPLASA